MSSCCCRHICCYFFMLYIAWPSKWPAPRKIVPAHACLGLGPITDLSSTLAFAKKFVWLLWKQTYIACEIWLRDHCCNVLDASSCIMSNLRSYVAWIWCSNQSILDFSLLLIQGSFQFTWPATLQVLTNLVHCNELIPVLFSYYLVQFW